MRLAYQVATNDVKLAPGVTAYQGKLDNSFRAVKGAGYDGVELMVADPDLVDYKKVMSLSQEYELPISMVCTGEVFGQDGLSFTLDAEERRKEAVKRVKQAVDLAERLSAPFVNVGRVRGGLSLGGDHEEERARSISGLTQVAQYAKLKNVIIALEPVNSIAATFINSTQDGLSILKEIGESHLKLMLDSNHMFLDDLDPVESIQEARGYFVYVHLADSNRLYPGNCKLNFKEFIFALKAVGYDGWLSVEVFQRPDQDTALKKSIAHIRPLIS